MTGSEIPVVWPTDIDSTSSDLCDQLNEALSDKFLRIVQLSYKLATKEQELLILLFCLAMRQTDHLAVSAIFWSVISQCDADCAMRSFVNKGICTKSGPRHGLARELHSLVTGRFTLLRKVLHD